jgi:hypothetical protein
MPIAHLSICSVALREFTCLQGDPDIIQCIPAASLQAGNFFPENMTFCRRVFTDKTLRRNYQRILFSSGTLIIKAEVSVEKFSG